MATEVTSILFASVDQHAGNASLLLPRAHTWPPTAPGTRSRSSGASWAVPLLAVEDSRCDPADARGVGDRVDLDDLAIGDYETHHGDGPFTPKSDHPGGAVHQRGPQAESGQNGHEPDERLAGYGRCATDHHGGCGAPGARVEPHYDAGIKHRDEGVEVTPARGREEGVDHLPLASEIAVRSRYLGALHAA